MRSIPVLLLALSVASCSSSAIEKRLAGSDSLVINFNLADTDSITGTVTTTETKAMAKIARFMAGKEMPKPTCGYGGNMLFFKNGQQALPVVFHLDKDCRYFMYELDNKLHYTRMPDEAVDFLNSLSAGKNWY